MFASHTIKTKNLPKNLKQAIKAFAKAEGRKVPRTTNVTFTTAAAMSVSGLARVGSGIGTSYSHPTKHWLDSAGESDWATNTLWSQASFQMRGYQWPILDVTFGNLTEEMVQGLATFRDSEEAETIAIVMDAILDREMDAEALASASWDIGERVPTTVVIAGVWGRPTPVATPVAENITGKMMQAVLPTGGTETNETEEQMKAAGWID